MRNQIKKALREQRTPFGDSEEEIVLNISSAIMGHINPVRELAMQMQQAIADGNVELAKVLCDQAQQEMNGVAGIFQQMQDYLDANGG